MTRFALLLAVTGLTAWPASADPPSHAGGCRTVMRCRAELARAHEAIAWQRKARRDVMRRASLRYRPSVTAALRLAAAVSGVSFTSLYQIAWCESRLWPFATNGQYGGLFQLSSRHRSALEGSFGVSWTDPYVNATYAATYMARHGMSEWQCRPDGGLRW